MVWSNIWMVFFSSLEFDVWLCWNFVDFVFVRIVIIWFFWCNWNEFIEKREIEWENEKKSVIMCKNGANQILEVFVKMIKKLTWNWNCCLSKSVTLYTIGLDSMKSEKGINYVFTSRLHKSVDLFFVVVIYCLRWLILVFLRFHPSSYSIKHTHFDVSIDFVFWA